MPVTDTDLGEPWGKLQDGARHHLLHHCADVAACFELLVRLPVVRARLERAAARKLTETDLSRLAVLAFLHDCGKLHPGFQAKGWPQGIWHAALRGHLREGASIFMARDRPFQGRMAEHLCLGELLDWGVGPDLLLAVLAHHGRPFALDMSGAARDWQPVAASGYDPLAAGAQMGACLRRWFAPAFASSGQPPLPDAPDFQHLLCGLLSLADWLGSDARLFAFQARLDPDYIETARARAGTMLSGVGLVTEPWRAAMPAPDRIFTALSRHGAPRPAQAALSDWPLDDPLVILEAETGSGKTEAALWRFARLFAAGQVDSLYFALPTRAAAKQIHGRVDAAMRRLFGDGAPQAVLAVPGYLAAGTATGRALPEFKVLWDDDPGEQAAIARWAAESGRRYLAAPIAIGTVDQVMLAALQVKHAHLRGAALSRSLLVIDEVHASDPYMSAIQSLLLDIHLGRGGHALLMSATLGASARSRWLGGARTRPPPFAQAADTPYPALWGRHRQTPHAVEGDGRAKSVAMTLAPSWEADQAAEIALDAARHGARVLVIRNTVAAAVATLEAVIAADGRDLLWQVEGGPALHHSRFAPEDRELLDTAVETALSPNSDIRPAGGAIVIGTQTLEQSLDICADMLVTDLCPADVLLQRIGRLHRHALVRPAGFEAPRCAVLSPAGGLAHLVAPAFENGLGSFRDGGGVYRNLHACELTCRLVLDHPLWVIPRMNRLLVESATHDERLEALSDELGPAWAAYWNTQYGRDLADTAGAGHVALRVTDPFSEIGLFPDQDEKIRTRLGAEGASIRFADPVPGPFGRMIGGITLPAHWSKGIVADEPVRPAPAGDGTLRFEAGGRPFLYGRLGVKRNSYENY